jgi:hypothetical protein
VAANDADATWAIADVASRSREAGFVAAAVFDGGEDRDPFAQAASWKERLRGQGFDAAVEPAAGSHASGIPRQTRRHGAVLLVAEHDRVSTFEIFARAGGGFAVLRPQGAPDVLLGEEALLDERDKSGRGVIITSTRAIQEGREIVRIVPAANIIGVRADDSGRKLLVRDESGHVLSWPVTSVGQDETWMTLLTVAAPDAVRWIFDQVCAGIDTGDIAARLTSRSAFGVDHWSRVAVRAVITSRAVEYGSSPAGIIDSGTWQQAQLALRREMAQRGTWRERVRPSLPALIPLAVFAGVAFVIYGGVRDWLTPRGSTASKPYWLTQQANVSGGWKMDVEGTSFWPFASAPQLVVDLSLANERVRPSSVGPLIGRLRVGSTHGARHPPRPCYGNTGLLSPHLTIVPRGSASGVVCFDVVVLHPASVRLVVEPRSGTRDRVVWFGLVKAPVDNSGDGGG